MLTRKMIVGMISVVLAGMIGSARGQLEHYLNFYEIKYFEADANALPEGLVDFSISPFERDDLERYIYTSFKTSGGHLTVWNISDHNNINSAYYYAVELNDVDVNNLFTKYGASEITKDKLQMADIGALHQRMIDPCDSIYDPCYAELFTEDSNLPYGVELDSNDDVKFDPNGEVIPDSNYTEYRDGKTIVIPRSYTGTKTSKRLTFNMNNACVREYAVGYALKVLSHGEDNSLFIDNITVYWFQYPYICDCNDGTAIDKYSNQMVGILQEIKARADPNIIINGLSSYQEQMYNNIYDANDPNDPNFGCVDGLMVEKRFWWDYYCDDIEFYREWLNKAAAKNMKVLFAAADDYTGHKEEFGRDSQLIFNMWLWLHLVAESNTYSFVSYNYVSPMTDYAIYDYPLGDPCEDPNKVGNVWTREYEGGTIVFDTTSQKLSDIKLESDLTYGPVHNITQNTWYWEVMAAIGYANDGDVIEVAPGTYVETIDFDGVACTVRSSDPNDWGVVESTIIEANSVTCPVVFDSNEDANSILSGFTLKNGYYGIFCGIDCAPTIRKCIIEDNAYHGIYSVTSSSPVIENNKILENGSDGIYCYENSTTTIRNNLIFKNGDDGISLCSPESAAIVHNNTIVLNSDKGISKTFPGTAPIINNCIIWDNADDLLFCSATYSCISDCNDVGDPNITHNICLDPNFVDSENNDYHLHPYSPCVDNGDPNTTGEGQTDIDGESRRMDLDGETRPGSIVDMGADEVFGKVHNIEQDTWYLFIQEAIDDANDGDTIEAAQYTYYESINFKGKAITLQSMDPNNPEVVAATVIDVDGSGIVVTFDSSEDANSVLKGFTIMGGFQGIYCGGTSPEISNCVVRENGGGNDEVAHWKMDDNAANTTVSDSSGNGNNGTFKDSSGDPNTNAHDTDGLIDGALVFDGNDDYVNCGHDSSLDITDEITLAAWIYPESYGADVVGGGIVGKKYYTESRYSIRLPSGKGLQFRAAIDSGYINYQTSADIPLNQWTFAAATYNGSKVRLYINDAVEEWSESRSLVSSPNNDVYIGSVYASGVRFFDGNIDDVMIFDRALSAAEIDVLYHSGGGGICCVDSASPTIINCTLYSNTANFGGGMHNIDSSPTVINCTFSENSAAGDGGGIYNRSSNPEITNCILWADTASSSGDEIYNYSSNPVVSYSDVEGGWSGTGNINSDPLFVDPDNDDYHLEQDSPCIDVGDPNGTYAGEVDIDGDDRVIDIAGKGDGDNDVDMGADEVIGVGVYNVTQALHYMNIQDAIDDANDGDEIVVYEGTYYENIDFLGKAITVRSADPNDPELVAATVIDGNDANSVVIFNSSEDANSVLTGFTITNGSGYYYSGFYHGGGIYCYNASPTITNCTITGNSSHTGGGICGYNASPAVSNCVFSENNASGCGGGMFIQSYSNPNVTNCTFSGNSADDGGGGMFNNYYSDPNVTNCIFSGNFSVDEGGGMYNLQSSPTVTNCTFSGNSATDYGGGMFNICYSNPNVINCTFSGNSADYGGGMCNYATFLHPYLANCIFWGNNASVAGDEIYNHYYYDDPNISYCDIEGCGGSGPGWDPNLGTDGGGNIDEDPLFTDPNNDDYHLDQNSPCIDAGDPNGDYHGQTDIDGNCRDVNGVDIGADEVCVPTTYSTYDDWVTLGKPDCWCQCYQCDGDADGSTEDPNNYRIYDADVDLITANWKLKIDDPNLDPCADIDHKAEGFAKYRVFINDLQVLIDNWQKTDPELPGDCPRPE